MGNRSTVTCEEDGSVLTTQDLGVLVAQMVWRATGVKTRVTVGRLVAAVQLLAGLLLGALASAPNGVAQSTYPDITGFTNAGSLEKFRVVDRDGIWFTNALGTFCGIDDDGGYGCSGTLPGVLVGENEIAWFPTDPFPRLYRTDNPAFASGRNQEVLVAKTFIVYRGSACATTLDASIYCINGDNPDSQLLVTPSATYRGRQAQPSS